jgi:hypothetical protein
VQDGLGESHIRERLCRGCLKGGLPEGALQQGEA